MLNYDPSRRPSLNPSPDSDHSKHRTFGGSTPDLNLLDKLSMSTIPGRGISTESINHDIETLSGKEVCCFFSNILRCITIFCTPFIKLIIICDTGLGSVYLYTFDFHVVCWYSSLKAGAIIFMARAGNQSTFAVHISTIKLILIWIIWKVKYCYFVYALG